MNDFSEGIYNDRVCIEKIKLKNQFLITTTKNTEEKNHKMSASVSLAF